MANVAIDDERKPQGRLGEGRLGALVERSTPLTRRGSREGAGHTGQVYPASDLFGLTYDVVPARAQLAFHILNQIQWGSLVVVLPNGMAFRFRGRKSGKEAQITLRNYSLFGKLMRSGTLGFGEAYLGGDWESPDVTALLEVAVRNAATFETFFRSGRLMRPLQKLYLRATRNSRRGSRRNIMAHYDLGNAFYSAWLDPSMTYSSALFHSADESLEEAQANKYRALAEALDLQPHHHVLEIGCGWGGFAAFATREIGCKVTGITISPAQHAFATERLSQVGPSSQAEILLQDYRDVTGSFDRIVSIEMLEAVGSEHWPAYFETLRARLRPGGKAGVQVITIRDEAFEFYASRVDFIQRYIFPGGLLPSPSKLRDAVEAGGLSWEQDHTFGRDYARTLRLWRNAFNKRWPDIEALGFDERFYKLWTYYLSYCEAGFEGGNIDVMQFVVGRPASSPE